MKLQKFGKKIILVLIFTCLVVFVVFALGSTTTNQRAQAAAPLSNLNAPNSPADDGLFSCVISNSAVFTERIHVQCTTTVPNTGIRFFASSGDSAHELATNRFLTLMNTAFALGKPLGIYYLTDTASNPPGCGASDCRAIDWMYIVP